MTTTRTQYREVIHQVAEKARAILPAGVNGRIEKAVKMVLAGDVEAPAADGSITVYSASDATRRYVLQGTSCTCSDYERGQAPQGWCAHRIAAGIHKRVGELLPAPEPVEMPAAAPMVLPEAPASVNCHLMIEGRQVQITLRDTDEQRLLARLAAVLRQYPVLPSASAENQRSAPGETRGDKGQPGWCQIHACAMHVNEKDGRTWYSHRTDDGWCKGRRVQR